MPDRTAYSLTYSQQEHLLDLLEAGATSREGAVSIFDHAAVRNLNPNVVGILCDKGFADRRVRTRKDRRLTVYWLTDTGVAKARELSHIPVHQRGGP